jgi:hypothetical protein
MFKQYLIVIFILLTIIAGISGCTTKTATNGTWGEKKLSLDAITVSDNTTGNRSITNNTRYYVTGYLINGNPIDALNVKLKVTTYDSQNNTVSINDTPYLNPTDIPANGNSYFYARFSDPDKKIVNFKVEIVDAKSKLL